MKMSKTMCLGLVVAALVVNMVCSAPPLPSPSCAHPQIQVSQAVISQHGIPRFSVTITNLCSDCWIAQLHLHCGQFASANVVNPKLFKRLTNGDCLVNGGRPIRSGKVIEFEYSNTSPYPFSVGRFVCGHN